MKILFRDSKFLKFKTCASLYAEYRVSMHMNISAKFSDLIVVATCISTTHLNCALFCRFNSFLLNKQTHIAFHCWTVQILIKCDHMQKYTCLSQESVCWFVSPTLLNTTLATF